MTATTADFVVRTTIDADLADGTTLLNRCVIAVRDLGIGRGGATGDAAVEIDLQDDHGAIITVTLHEVAAARHTTVQRDWQVAGGLLEAA